MTSIPTRFAIFGGLCVTWALAMSVSDHVLVQAAGTAWFANWTIQVTVTLVSWAQPFTLPNRYYQPWWQAEATGMPPLFGLWIFEEVVRRINPLPFRRHSFATLDEVMRAAETTHAITFVIGTVLAMGMAASGSILTASCLAFWNVIFNAYAIALQRRNRVRIGQLARRRAEQKASGPRSADRRRPAPQSAAASSSP